jgi:hypothetical protein
MSNTQKDSASTRSEFDPCAYVAEIERRIASILTSKKADQFALGNAIDLRAPEAWPAVMELAEVAIVLRYADEDTVRDLTDLPFDEGGLRYISIGAGRKRRKRLVRKGDLLDFMARNSVTPTRPEIAKPKRRKPEPRRETGGLMARRIGRASRT